MKKSIYCLFVANEYNQPYNNNLVAWWSVKPTGAQIAKVCNFDINTEAGETAINQLSQRGFYDDMYGDRYRIELIEEGRPV